MTHGLVQRITVEESVSIQWIKGNACLGMLKTLVPKQYFGYKTEFVMAIKSCKHWSA